MASKRQHKFARMIQKELGEIFQKDRKGLFHNAIVGVTNIEMSPDLSVATAQLSFVVAGDQDKDTLFELVNKNKGEIRKQLGNSIGKQTRKIPELIFHIDRGAEHADKIDQILRGLNIPPATDKE